MNWLRKLFTRPAPQDRDKDREKQLLRARLIAVAVGRATHERGALS